MILLIDYSPTYLCEAEKYLDKMGLEVITAAQPRDMIRMYVYSYEDLSAVVYDSQRLKRDGVLHDMLEFIQRHFDMRRELFIEWNLLDALESGLLPSPAKIDNTAA